MFRLFLALLGGLCLATPALAQQRLEGSLPDAAGLYRIDLPAGWQPGDRLIIFNHGLTMQQPEQVGFPRTAPNTTAGDYWLQQGYALAAGSFASRGWALFDIEREQRALLAEFRRRAGEPGEILLVGGSLGGLVSMRTAESFAREGVDVAGVYTLCPPLAGARSWDAALDTRMLYDAVCADDPLPTGSPHLPWVVPYHQIPSTIGDIETFDDALTLIAMGSVANRIRQCTGFFQPSWLPATARQLANRERLKSLMGITSDSFLRTNLAYSIYVKGDLIQAPEKLAGRNPFDNRFVDYGDPDINARIQRVERDPLAAVKLRAESDLSGQVGGARILGVHTQRDELVVPEHLHVLQQLPIPPDQRVTALIREDAPAHCRFSVPEFVAGFDALRDWIDDGVQPDTAALQQRCIALRAQFGADERCNYDPGLQPAAIDTRVRPRNLDLHAVGRFESGAWYDPATDGEGAIIEVLDAHRATVAWYSYPASGEAGEQTWIIGLGRVTEDGIHVAEARQYHGARFGDAFDAGDIDGRVWGEFTLAFAGCGEGDLVHPHGLGVARLRYAGPPEYGVGERRLFQLSHNVSPPQHCAASPAPTAAHPQSRYSGSWYRGPEQAGEGLQLQVGGDGTAAAIWYTFDPQGRPAWLIGNAQLSADSSEWVIPMLRPRGTRFGEGFDPDAVQRPAWGEIRLDFQGCDAARLRWTSSEAGWGDGEVALQRLTSPAGIPGCD